jgi:hypothetical protein
MQMSSNMLLRKTEKTFLIPLDIDEFIVAVNYDDKVKFASTFSLEKAQILKNFDHLPLPVDQYGGKKYKFNTFDAIDCNVSLNAQLPPQAMNHHSQFTFVEATDTLSRCNGKTFYYSEGFRNTDGGNHYGEVMNQSVICHSKYKCKTCYHQFMKSGLGLVHYSTHSMNYNEVKAKMLHRLSVLPQFAHAGADTIKKCSKFKMHSHYCQFNALLLQHGDHYLIDQMHKKRQRKCATGVHENKALAALFSSQNWSVV